MNSTGDRRRGVVTRLKPELGYGFIRPDGGTIQDDHFFHRIGVAAESRKGFMDLVEGTRVEFEEEASSKGPRATNVLAL